MTDLASIKTRVEDLTEFEWSVLRAFNGGPAVSWGAAVSVALEYLSGLGLLTKTLPYQITEAGLSALSQKDTHNG